MQGSLDRSEESSPPQGMSPKQHQWDHCQRTRVEEKDCSEGAFHQNHHFPLKARVFREKEELVLETLGAGAGGSGTDIGVAIAQTFDVA